MYWIHTKKKLISLRITYNVTQHDVNKRKKKHQIKKCKNRFIKKKQKTIKRKENTRLVPVGASWSDGLREHEEYSQLF